MITILIKCRPCRDASYSKLRGRHNNRDRAKAQLKGPCEENTSGSIIVTPVRRCVEQIKRRERRQGPRGREKRCDSTRYERDCHVGSKQGECASAAKNDMMNVYGTAAGDDDCDKQNKGQGDQKN